MNYEEQDEYSSEPFEIRGLNMIRKAQLDRFEHDEVTRRDFPHATLKRYYGLPELLPYDAEIEDEDHNL